MTDVDRSRDEWLALRCQAKELGAFEDLVRHMERPLFYFLGKTLGDRELALDILQEVWLRAARTIGSLREPASVRPWLYRIARGLAIDHIRHDRRRSDAESKHAIAEDTNDLESFRSIEALDIHRSLDRLEDGQRELLTLFFLEDFAIGEIARIVGVPEGTVKSRLHYAKKSLKQLLLKGTNYA